MIERRLDLQKVWSSIDMIELERVTVESWVQSLNKDSPSEVIELGRMIESRPDSRKALDPLN